MKKTRILIADDHQVVRKGVAAILSERPEWEICGEAATGRQAITIAARVTPDSKTESADASPDLDDA